MKASSTAPPALAMPFLKVSISCAIAAVPFDLTGPVATIFTVSGGRRFSPGTWKIVPVASRSL